MPYTYTGLKEWTGNYCNGVALDDPQDFWNEHQFYYEFSPINEIWVEYIPGRGRDTHYICTSSVMPCILEPLLYAAVKRCRNFRPEYADFM